VAGDGIPTRPDQVGFGAGYRFLPGARLEATHRQVRLPGDSASYGITSVGVRTEAFLGGQVRGELERVDGGAGAADNRTSHAAVLGWSQRLAIAGGWSLSTLFERRIGLSRAAVSDPLRALPFAQDERNRWSAGAGLEWLPAGEQARFSLRTEAHDGQDRRGFRVELAGDAPLGRSTALVTLNDWSRDRRLTVAGAPMSEQDRSLLGLAFRPVSSDRLNGLFKLEYRRSVNPLAGTALANTVAGASGRAARLIGAAEAVWAVSPGTEIAGRYAMRWSDDDLATAGLQRIELAAHFGGVRVERSLGVARDRLRARLDGRVLVETASGARTWNVAPSLAWRLDARLELEGGYRMGDLEDEDFGARGGHGLFAAMSLRFTEKSLKGPGAFWRERVAREP
jgi:hypothetical protein